MSEVNNRRVVVLSTSLSSGSRSRVLAQYAVERLKAQGEEPEYIDLRSVREGQLPFAGSAAAWQADAEIDALKETLRGATHLLMAVPIYNFDVSAAAKNLVELMGEKELGGKTVGFLCAAGGQRSYMSVLSFANSLMLDFRCWIVPRFVYATRQDVVEGVLVGEEVKERIGLLCAELFER